MKAIGFMLCAFVVVTASLFAGPHGHAQTPTVNIDPSVDYFKIDMTRPPDPVYVTNFPETQAVTGTVSIDNLPAVQTVGGTVNVGNLPLDADGAVRVTSAPAKQMVWYELLDAPVLVSGVVEIPTTINTSGYSQVSVLAVAAGETAAVVRLRWQFADDEEFLPAYDARNGLSYGEPVECFHYTGRRLVCPNLGGKVRVALNPYGGPAATVTSVRVYLIP